MSLYPFFALVPLRVSCGYREPSSAQLFSVWVPKIVKFLTALATRAIANRAAARIRLVRRGGPPCAELWRRCVHCSQSYGSDPNAPSRLIADG